MNAGKTFWKMNQNGKYHLAEILISLVKNPRNISVTTFAFGNKMRYAPSTPEIAPDAPNAGSGLDGSDKIWKKVSYNTPKKIER